MHFAFQWADRVLLKFTCYDHMINEVKTQKIYISIGRLTEQESSLIHHRAEFI